MFAVPENFRGVTAPALSATEIHTLGGVLGSTIEQEVVETLNRLRRTTWDPGGELAGYRFVRQAQVFPDVVLKATDPDTAPQILIGIELKGWYVLAKERMPNYRFKATPRSCAEEDMLAVFPWALSQVISGEAQVLSPWIVSARYAAEYRNWHWVHGMGSMGVVPGDGEPEAAEDLPAERGILLSAVTRTYPESKTEEHNDEARHDRGGNFGRIARTGLMNKYMQRVFEEEELAGISLQYWQRFLKLFGKDTPTDAINRTIDAIGREISGRGRAEKRTQLQELKRQVLDLAAALEALPEDS